MGPPRFKPDCLLQLQQERALYKQIERALKKKCGKKRATVLASSTPVTEASEKETTLERVSCLRYSVQFWKNRIEKVLVLIYFGSKINAISPAYTKKLGLHNKPTNIEAWKIDELHLDTFGMTIVGLLL